MLQITTGLDFWNSLKKIENKDGHASHIAGGLTELDMSPH